MRLFIAATFPEEAVRPLNERLELLKPKLPRASWVRPETQHLTFAFLGEQDESAVNRIAVAGGSRFEASLRGCGFFPNRRRARVGRVGPAPQEQCSALPPLIRAAR